MSPLGLLHKALVVGGLLLYASALRFGWDLPSAHHELVPPSVRSSPGGYRSYHFWHSGFMGGK
ncbi:MAG: hypothetical protein ACYDCL_17525 [Myxococcales bacterium]